MRRWFALALLLSPHGCFGATELVLPTPPEGARSVFVIRACEFELSATVHRVEDVIMPTIEACSGRLTYFALYSDETLETLSVAPGPVPLGSCPDALEPCCVEEKLPTIFYFASVGPDARVNHFEPAAAGAPPLPADRYQRACRCPSMKSRPLMVGDGLFNRVYAAANSVGQVVLASHRSYPDVGACTGTTEGCETLFDTELYATTLEELRGEGVPSAPYARLEGSGVASVALSEDGIVFLGFLDRAEVLSGPLGSEPASLPVSIDNEAIRLVAVNSLSAAPIELAVARGSGPDALRVYREGGWQALGSDAIGSQSCAPDDHEQRIGLAFTPQGDLLFMPHGISHNKRREITPLTAPNGVFRFREDSAEWIEGPYDPTDCLEVLGFAEGLGVLVATRSGRVYREDKSGWMDPAPLARAGYERLQSRRGALASFPGGYAFGGQSGVFGYAVDGVLCHQSLLGTNRIENLTWAGETLIATGSKPDSGRLTIYLIDFAEP